MDRKKIGALLFGATLTLASASGFAFNNRSQSYPYGYPHSQQTQKSQDRALRAAIKAKRKEVKELQKAGDPRAAYAARELDALNQQWHATHGNGNGHGNGRYKNSTYSNGVYVNPDGSTIQNRRGDDDEDQAAQGRQNGHGKHGKGRDRGHENDDNDD